MRADVNPATGEIAGTTPVEPATAQAMLRNDLDICDTIITPEDWHYEPGKDCRRVAYDERACNKLKRSHCMTVMITRSELFQIEGDWGYQVEVEVSLPDGRVQAALGVATHAELCDKRKKPSMSHHAVASQAFARAEKLAVFRLVYSHNGDKVAQGQQAGQGTVQGPGNPRVEQERSQRREAAREAVAAAEKVKQDSIARQGHPETVIKPPEKRPAPAKPWIEIAETRDSFWKYCCDRGVKPQEVIKLIGKLGDIPTMEEAQARLDKALAERKAVAA